MEILNETIGGVPVGTLIIGVAIVLAIVWLWSQWGRTQGTEKTDKKG
jgi:hypothetical protein